MRYIIEDESLSAHCCFGWSIVDTTVGKIDTIHGPQWADHICEGFEEKYAILICDALNKLENEQRNL
jgi:hypothetical protein